MDHSPFSHPKFILSPARQLLAEHCPVGIPLIYTMADSERRGGFGGRGGRGGRGDRGGE